MTTSLWLFTALVFVLGVQRLLEVRHSRRNERWLRAHGGVEHAPAQVPVMTALHAAWLLSMLVEVWVLRPAPEPLVSVLALLALGAGQTLRLTAIRTLGKRWSVRVMTLPGRAPVQRGLYRHVRHPNYAGVALEIAAVPLLHFAFRTALVFSLLNGLLLLFRIRAEEAALRGACPGAARA